MQKQFATLAIMALTAIFMVSITLTGFILTANQQHQASGAWITAITLPNFPAGHFALWSIAGMNAAVAAILMLIHLTPSDPPRLPERLLSATVFPLWASILILAAGAIGYGAAKFAG